MATKPHHRFMPAGSRIDLLVLGVAVGLLLLVVGCGKKAQTPRSSDPGDTVAVEGDSNTDAHSKGLKHIFDIPEQVDQDTGSSSENSSNSQ